MLEFGGTQKEEQPGNPAAPLERRPGRSGQAGHLEDLGEGLVDGEALLVLLYVLLALLVRHLVEQNLRALERDAPAVLQLPHLVILEEDVWLRDQGLAVGADV